MDLTLTPSTRVHPLPKPVVLCILDGVGLGAKDGGDAVHLAKTPTLDRLFSGPQATQLAAHGPAVGLPGEGDMGNSEVGHNALGAGRVFAQGAKLVNAAIADGGAFGETWEWLTQSGTLHLLGLLSDGNVHSHIKHLLAILDRAAADGVQRVRVHILTDGRDVGSRTSLTYIRQLQEHLDHLGAQGVDYRVASGGGRMLLTMDRYEADWEMVQRGWDAHILGQGRQFDSAEQAVQTLYDEDPKVNDQYLPAFVIAQGGEALGRVEDGDALLFFNFRGDRALEISRACEVIGMQREGSVPIDGRDAPSFRYAGMMEYDGDLHIPQRYLVAPPAINRTVGQYLVANGKRSFAISETQKFGHVTFFFNGNRSGLLDAELEQYVEIPSDNVSFDTAPRMKAVEITDRVVQEVGSGRWDHIRLNIANGDMVGHTGALDATVEAMECVDACVARIEAAVLEAGGVLLVTADHGNADDMWMRNKDGSPKQQADGPVPRTSHTLAPVPFALVDASGHWALDVPADPGLANVSATLLVLMGLEPPADYLPPLVRPA